MAVAVAEAEEASAELLVVPLLMKKEPLPIEGMLMVGMLKVGMEKEPLSNVGMDIAFFSGLHTAHLHWA